MNIGIDFHIVFICVILFILILLSAYFSAAETALISFKRGKLKEIRDKDPKIGALLRLWLKKPNELLTTIILGNNIINILSTALFSFLMGSVLAEKFGNAQAVVITTGIMSFLIIVFGEITPKIIAKNYSAEISKFVIKPMYYLSVMVLPIIIILTSISKILSRMFGVKIKKENLLITEEEIKSMIMVGEEEGVLEEEEREMIHGIFSFGDRTVEEVMVPRINVFAIEATQTLEEVWSEILDKGFSRVPVYEDTIDNIIGILYMKDLLPISKAGNLKVLVKDLIREAYFVPDSKSSIDLLKEFKEKHIHISIIVDEYGGTLGIVTIEDLLEEIVGDINDEYDKEEEKEIKKISENKFEIEALIAIPDLNKLLDINLPESDEYDTLSGYINYILGKVPVISDKLENDEIKLEVIRVEHNRSVCVILEKKLKNEENIKK